MHANAPQLAQSKFARAVNTAEEAIIAILLGVMTLITFVNVVLRYGFNSNLIWGLEIVLVLFAWLVLFGITYGFKITSHLGVDALTNLLPNRQKRILALVSAIICLIYAALLMKGAWDYWAPFAGLQQTTGRWFPTGLDASTRDRAFYITDQVPMPGFLAFLGDLINQGEAYDKLPRVIPYAMLPLATLLMFYRIAQATFRIATGTQNSMIVSHEAEEAVDEAAAKLKDA
jgi:C4-dicarboxylate transporter DctQ subunit